MIFTNQKEQYGSNNVYLPKLNNEKKIKRLQKGIMITRIKPSLCLKELIDLWKTENGIRQMNFVNRYLILNQRTARHNWIEII